MVKEKVSANHFFLLLYLSLLSSVFMYLSSSHIEIASSDALLRPIVFIALSFLFFIPTALILKKHNELKSQNLYVPPTTTLRLVAFVYALVYFTGIIKAVARLDLFVSSELFPNADMTVFLVAIIAVCTGLSFLGIGALSRAAAVFIVAVILSTLLVMLSLYKEIDFLNFTPLFENGTLHFAEECLIFSMQATEIGTIVIFIPEITGNIKKKFIGWSIFSGLSFSAVFFFVVGSLGAFADTQLFPTYSSVTLASFGLLERIDALETAIWVLCVVEKISFYFLVTVKTLKYSFKGVSGKALSIICAIAVSLIIMFVSRDILNFAFLSSNPLSVILFTVSVAVLPMILYLYIKRVKPCEKIQENI